MQCNCDHERGYICSARCQVEHDAYERSVRAEALADYRAGVLGSRVPEALMTYEQALRDAGRMR